MTIKSGMLPVPTAPAGPPEKPPQVPLDAEPVMSDQELEQTLQKAGNLRVSAPTVAQLRKIGLKVRGMGVTHIQRGAVMLDQAKCDEMLDMLLQAMAKRLEQKETTAGLVKEMAIMTQAYATLVGKKTDIQRLSLEIERSVAPSGVPLEEKPAPLAGFVPGQPVVPAGGTLVVAQNVNLSAPGAKEPAGG